MAWFRRMRGEMVSLHIRVRHLEDLVGDLRIANRSQRERLSQLGDLCGYSEEWHPATPDRLVFVPKPTFVVPKGKKSA